jgi:hypothetical protein
MAATTARELRTRFGLDEGRPGGEQPRLRTKRRLARGIEDNAFLFSLRRS